MAQTIDEADYDIEVEKMAQNLADVVEDTEESPVEAIIDVLDGHDWFVTTRSGLTGADFGAIVSDFTHFGGNVENYRDPETMTSSMDFERVLRSMAFAQFEADILWFYQNEINA